MRTTCGVAWMSFNQDIKAAIFICNTFNRRWLLDESRQTSRLCSNKNIYHRVWKMQKRYFLTCRKYQSSWEWMAVTLTDTSEAWFRFVRDSLVCVSCPSATEFLAILFLLFARSSSISPRSFQGFRRTLRQNFNWIRQRIKNFPIDPHCKNWPLSATL